jgi:pilus assembly protein CpaF
MVLDEQLSQDGLTDLVLNGSDAFALIRGVWQSVDLDLSPAEVARLAVELCDRGGRHLDLANPFADVSVDGMRVHAVLAAGVSEQPLLSIRKHSARVIEVAVELQELVCERKNFLVSGATGAGKTTLIRSMLSQLDDRVITIEDVAELGFERTNFVSLVARQANIEGRGELGVERLFREALRMRPDRIVLGEVRGSEFGLLLQALNTGHSGSAATLHANSLAAVPDRLIALGLMSGFSPDTTIALAKTAIDSVIHIEGRQFRVARLGELFE